MKKRYLEAGEIVNTHGIRGEVRIKPWSNNPEFLQGFSVVYIDEQAFSVNSSRVHKSSVIMSLNGISDINDAMRLKGKTLFIDRSDSNLEDGEFFLQDIVGAEVVTEDGAILGILAEIIDLPAGNVYVVRGEREILIPAVPEFILNTDIENEKITVRLIEGL